MTDFIPYFWIASLLILVLALGVFLTLSYRHRQQLDALEQQVHDHSQRLTESFLQREIQLTRQRQSAIATDANANPASFERLRLFWLEAEFAALAEQGKRRSNYDTLQRKAQPLLRLLQRPSDKPTATAAKAAVKWSSGTALSQLQKARAAINAQSESVALHRKKSAPEKPEITKTLNDVNANNTELIATISRLEKELSAMQGKFNAANTQLAQLQQNVGNSVAAAENNNAPVARELIAEIEQSYQQTVTEMNRMREINRGQRQLILELEQQLSKLRTDSVQYGASVELVDKLKLQLRDYETCTAILEMEADSLRERLQVLNETERQSEASGAEPQSPLLAYLAPAKVQSSQHDALQLIEQVAAHENIETIGKLLIDWLRSRGVSAVLFIKSAPEPIWISSEIAVDSHSKQLLQSIVPVPAQPLVEVDEGFVLAHPLCRLLLYTTSELNEKNSELAQRAQIVTQIIERWLALLTAQQSNRANTQLDSAMRQRLRNLLTQYDYIGEEHSRAREKLGQELETFFNTADISDVQRLVAHSMLEDFDAQIDILRKAGFLIRTSIATIASDPENTK
jgi:hypothetical protein